MGDTLPLDDPRVFQFNGLSAWMLEQSDPFKEPINLIVRPGDKTIQRHAHVKNNFSHQILPVTKRHG